MTTNPLEQFVRGYYNDPVGLVRDWLDMDGRDAKHTIDPKQIEIMQAVARGDRRIAVRSGHGVGKTALLSWLIIWFLLTRFPMKVQATAPTSGQLFNALASEVKGWLTKLPIDVQELFEIKAERIELKAAPAQSFVAFATSRADTPEALAGVHSDNVLLIGDEGSGIPDPVFVSSAGSMAGPNRQMLLAGNPVRTSGLFFRIFNKPDTMAEWTRFHISCVDHPRIPADFCTNMAAQYGEKSNTYRVRVLGEFPLAEDEKVIPFELIEASLLRDVQPIGVKPIWGVDCARGGPDRSALAKRKGNVLLEKVKTWQGLDTMELAGRIKQEWDAASDLMRPSVICIDVIGIGAGVVDRLRELGLPVAGVNVGESASTKDMFANLKAELWWKCREWFAARDTNLANDKDLADELTEVGFQPGSAKISIEKKETLKKRGIKSPDLADAFILTFGREVATMFGGKNAPSQHKALRRPIRGIV